MTRSDMPEPTLDVLETPQKRGAVPALESRRGRSLMLHDIRREMGSADQNAGGLAGGGTRHLGGVV